MENKNEYLSLLSEIVAKQSIILGPDIAILKAKSVAGIEVDSSGKVISISGDPQQAVQELIDAYVELSGQIVKSALGSVFTKYPNIKADK